MNVGDRTNNDFLWRHTLGGTKGSLSLSGSVDLGLDHVPDILLDEGTHGRLRELA